MRDDPKGSGGLGRYTGAEPPQPGKPTEKIEQTGIIEGLLRVLQRETQAGFEEIKADVRAIDARVERVEKRAANASGGIRAVKASDATQEALLATEIARAARLEQEISELRTQNANLTKQYSELKESYDKISTEVAAVKTLTVDQNKELEEQTAILKRLGHVADNPVIKDLIRVGATAIVTAISAWIALGRH